MMKRLLFILLNMIIVLCPLHAQNVKGDITGDGNLTLDDATMLKDILLGKFSSSLPLSRLDINGDGDLSVTDITKLVDMVLNKKEGGIDVGIGGWDDSDEDFGGTVCAPPRLSSAADYHLSIDDLMLQPGETADVPVAMDNASAFNGFQMNITLPEGFEFVRFGDGAFAQLTRKTSSHIIDNSAISNNAITIISYSSENAVYPDTSGDLLKIRVKAKDETGDHIVRVSGIELSDNSFKAIRLNENSGKVTVNNKYIVTIVAPENGTIEGTGGTYWGGTSVTIKATPGDGYYFKQWTNGSVDNPLTFIVDSDINISAIFSPKSYTLTYYVDGEVYKTETYEFGAQIIPIKYPEKEGYDFSGWSEIPETMPAHDIIAEGTFVNSTSVGMMTDIQKVDVYTLNGMLVKKAVNISELKTILPSGVYIINQRKYIVK